MRDCEAEVSGLHTGVVPNGWGTDEKDFRTMLLIASGPRDVEV